MDETPGTDEQPIRPLSTEEKFDVPPETAAKIEKAEGTWWRRSILAFTGWLRTSD
jgi:hypothetical protein